jgi:hypothetical protein
MNDPVIMCAICKKPVEKVSITYDPRRMIKWVRVECHGEKDTGFLHEVQVAYGVQVEAVAFKTKGIES